MNPVSSSFISSGLTSLGSGFVFRYLRNHAQDKALAAELSENKTRYTEDAQKYGTWRDAAFIIGGTSLLTGVVHGLFFKPDPDDVFNGTGLFSYSDISETQLFLFGCAAISSALTIYFDTIKSQSESRLLDAKDQAGIDFYNEKIKMNKSNRNHALIAAAASGVYSLFSYFLIEKENRSSQGRRQRGESLENTTITITPEITAYYAAIGLTIRF